jgi:predicted nuclease of predicted toxin-antitoxin system
VNIVADENVEKQIVHRLRAKGHEVLYIAELDPGVGDEAVLLRSRELNAILITADKDFGELVFRQRLHHAGIMLIRLDGLTPDQKADTVAAAFDAYGDALPQRFAVVSERSLRLRGSQG